jgi:hypothetical protein
MLSKTYRAKGPGVLSAHDEQVNPIGKMLTERYSIFENSWINHVSRTDLKGFTEIIWHFRVIKQEKGLPAGH